MYNFTQTSIMSFQPIISITNIPRSSASFIFTDTTGNYPTNPTGFGASDAPVDRNSISAMWAEVQPYGGEPVKSTNISGNLTGNITVTVSIMDGVQWLRVLYGELISLSFTVSTDRLTLSSADAGLVTKMDNVKFLALSGIDTPIRIKSVATGVVVLEAPLPGTNTFYPGIVRYWQAEVRVLVMNCAENMIGTQIARLPSYRTDCDTGWRILDKLLLKLNAQYAFNCGNFSEAHASAQMICGTITSSLQNCISCG